MTDRKRERIEAHVRIGGSVVVRVITADGASVRMHRSGRVAAYFVGGRDEHGPVRWMLWRRVEQIVRRPDGDDT